MKTEMTLRELSDEFGKDKKIRVLCEDENTIVFTFGKNQKPLSEGYSFEMGM
ncbi:MAG: hypothetical protein Q4G33_14620 [bacterium]|nr:hypothetical protein [bacterium]